MHTGAGMFDRTSQTDDARIRRVATLPPPEHLIQFFPVAGTPAEALISGTRNNLHRIVHGESDRLAVIIGPCSIHDPDAAMDYANRLAEQRSKFADDLEIVMRVYFEKPRTTVGWKGLINDPYLDGSFRINEGLRIARDLLLQINRLGVPAGSEFLDAISPQYIGDLVAWGAIGARTTESQVHRELASGLSAPIGFKNGTNGDVKIAIDAIGAASKRHHFLSVHKCGQVATVETLGNNDCHVILRGGKSPNYDNESIADCCDALRAAGLNETVMIDCSHANSNKDYRRQKDVAEAICEHIAAGNSNLMGVMLESNIVEGRQELGDGQNLVYGQSVTDACLGWETSVELLDQLAAAVRQRRQAR